jgi:hypothetical protein
VLKDQGTNYTEIEINDELQVYSDRVQRLSELLDTGRMTGYDTHPRFEEVKAVVQGEVLLLMDSAKQWLGGIKKGLVFVSSARKRRATSP